MIYRYLVPYFISKLSGKKINAKLIVVSDFQGMFLFLPDNLYQHEMFLTNEGSLFVVRREEGLKKIMTH